MWAQWIAGYVLGVVLVGSAALGTIGGLQVVHGAATAWAAQEPPAAQAVAGLGRGGWESPPALAGPALLAWVQERDQQARQFRQQRHAPAVKLELGSSDEGG